MDIWDYAMDMLGRWVINASRAEGRIELQYGGQWIRILNERSEWVVDHRQVHGQPGRGIIVSAKHRMIRYEAFELMKSKTHLEKQMLLKCLGEYDEKTLRAAFMLNM